GRWVRRRAHSLLNGGAVPFPSRGWWGNTMTIRVGSLPAAPIAVLLLGCACARVNVETSKRRGYEKKLDRTIVAFIGMERFGDSYQQMLHERTIAEFAKRGVAVAFATLDRPSLGETRSFAGHALAVTAAAALDAAR